MWYGKYSDNGGCSKEGYVLGTEERHISSVNPNSGGMIDGNFTKAGV
ncbi:hypothetical protein PAJ34TS1_42920 [Paenibacillus azoreducens]